MSVDEALTALPRFYFIHRIPFPLAFAGSPPPFRLPPSLPVALRPRSAKYNLMILDALSLSRVGLPRNYASRGPLCRFSGGFSVPERDVTRRSIGGFGCAVFS